MTRSSLPIRSIALTAMLVGAMALPAAPAPAATKTVTACVSSRTGAFTILLGKKAAKKCPRGYKKQHWAAAGQQGDPGPAGAGGAPGSPGPVHAPTMVKDAAGATLGQLLGYLPSSNLSIFFVLRDGGSYVYRSNGKVAATNASPDYKNNTCSGTAYITSSASNLSIFVSLSAGSTRVVYRASAPLGPTQAWKYTTATENIVALQLYQLDDSGACVTDGPPATTSLVALAPVTAPPDVPGPLTIS